MCSASVIIMKNSLRTVFQTHFINNNDIVVIIKTIQGVTLRRGAVAKG